MLRIPGQLGKDLCDRELGVTRHDLLRVGATALKTSSASRLRLTRFSAARRASETSHAHLQLVNSASSLVFAFYRSSSRARGQGLSS